MLARLAQVDEHIWGRRKALGYLSALWVYKVDSAMITGITGQDGSYLATWPRRDRTSDEVRRLENTEIRRTACAIFVISGKRISQDGLQKLSAAEESRSTNSEAQSRC